MKQTQSNRFDAPLVHRVPENANAAQIAAAVAEILEDIAVVLTPIVGERGVAALYKRSLYLAAAAHPMFAGMHEQVQSSVDVVAIQAVLMRDDAAAAAAGGSALLKTIQELLLSLIGETLTERLLQAVWTHTLRGPAAPENTR